MKKCNKKQDAILRGFHSFFFKKLPICILLALITFPCNLLLGVVEASLLPPNYISLIRNNDGSTNNPNALSSSSSELSSSEELTTFSHILHDDEVEFTTSTAPIDSKEGEDHSSSEVSVVTSKSTATLPTTTTIILGQGRQGVNEDDTPSNLVGPDGKRYRDIQATCDDRQMTVGGQFVSRFKGRIYAYGYPDEQECGVTAATSASGNISFPLPLGQCGVQMMTVDSDYDGEKRHEVTLYIQYSSFLQQVIDDKVTVSCVEVKKSPLEESMQSLEVGDLLSARQARRMGGIKETAKGSQQSQTKISSKIGESWMEILAGKDPSPKSRKLLPVAVGQEVTLVISTKVMRGYDARIVNCSANDGSKLGAIDGYRSQQILDSAGCSVDTALVPNFRRRRLPIESRNRLITLHFATFPAFKFPERDHLHIKCAVAYCQGPCPQDPCLPGLNHFGTWREKYGRVADALIDTTEIVNAIEVTAPELEDAGGGHHYERHQSNGPNSYSSHGGGSATDVSSRKFGESGSTSSYGSPKAHSHSSPEEIEGPVGSPSFINGGNVCVSPGSIILALVILGVVLVISASATLWFALKRSEAKKYRQAVKHTPFQHGPQPYYRFSHW